MITPWLWKITEYNINEDENKKLQEIIQNSLQISWNDLMDQRLNFAKEVLNRITVYAINKIEQKECDYLDAKGKWIDEMLWEQNRIYGEKTSGMMLAKLWKWYVKFKSSNFKFRKQFLEDFDGYEKIRSLFCDFILEESEESMQGFNFKTVGDNSYIKSRSKSETTATPILTGKLKKKDDSIDMNDKGVEQHRRNLKVKSLKQPMVCKGLPREPGNGGTFKLIMEMFDNSYKIIGAI
jgi:hypothetical protein